MTLTLHTLAEFEVGQKVATHAHTDLFMQGARFGRVTKVGRTYVWVEFPVRGITRRVPPSWLRITAPAHCTTTYAAPGHPHDGERCVLGWDHSEPCSFGQHRAPVDAVTHEDVRPPHHRAAHRHLYIPSMTDWWCEDCDTGAATCTDTH